MSNLLLRSIALGVLAFAYFVLFPDDLATVLTPLQQLLQLSYALSPWLYALLAVALLCWTLLRIRGQGPQREAPPT